MTCVNVIKYAAKTVALDMGILPYDAAYKAWRQNTGGEFALAASRRGVARTGRLARRPAAPPHTCHSRCCHLFWAHLRCALNGATDGGRERR